jgi:hypothetical protein
VEAVTSLVSALGGANALTSGGGPGGVTVDPAQNVVQQGDPTQGAQDMSGMDMTQHDATQHDATQHDATQHDATQHAGHTVVERTKPVDKKRAKAIAKAVSEFFGTTKRGDVTFKPGGQTHGRLTDEARAAFKKKYGLPAPRSVVFPKGGNKPIGVVYNEKVNGNFDLGMGVKHTHREGGNEMEHVWFTPGNLDLAYTDSGKGVAKQVQAWIKAHK